MNWQPFQKSRSEVNRDVLRDHLKNAGMPHDKAALDEAQRIADQEAQPFELWHNNLYVVLLTHFICKDLDSEMVYMSIRRQDRRPIAKWGDVQRIKNELVGVECEGVQMFPAETEKVDACNQYHLYVFTDPTMGLPFNLMRKSP